MRRQTACACVALALAAAWPGSGVAAPQRYVLDPRTVRVGFTAYGLGVIAIEGQFSRFFGTLTLDSADPTACAVSLTAESASLQMPSQSMTDSALGPSLLDVADFPTFKLEGACTGAVLQATVLLHGVTRPVALAVSNGHGRWQAKATIDRNQWGMGALPMLAGSQVSISITAGLAAP